MPTTKRVLFSSSSSLSRRNQNNCNYDFSNRRQIPFVIIFFHSIFIAIFLIALSYYVSVLFFSILPHFVRQCNQLQSACDFVALVSLSLSLHLRNGLFIMCNRLAKSNDRNSSTQGKENQRNFPLWPLSPVALHIVNLH